MCGGVALVSAKCMHARNPDAHAGYPLRALLSGYLGPEELCRLFSVVTNVPISSPTQLESSTVLLVRAYNTLRSASKGKSEVVMLTRDSDFSKISRYLHEARLVFVVVLLFLLSPPSASQVGGRKRKAMNHTSNQLEMCVRVS